MCHPMGVRIIRFMSFADKSMTGLVIIGQMHKTTQTNLHAIAVSSASLIDGGCKTCYSVLGTSDQMPGVALIVFIWN